MHSVKENQKLTAFRTIFSELLISHRSFLRIAGQTGKHQIIRITRSASNDWNPVVNCQPAQR